MLTIDCFYADLEKVLVDIGAVKENDTRLRKRSDSTDDEGSRRPKVTNNNNNSDDDDDWD